MQGITNIGRRAMGLATLYLGLIVTVVFIFDPLPEIGEKAAAYLFVLWYVVSAASKAGMVIDIDRVPVNGFAVVLWLGLTVFFTQAVRSFTNPADPAFVDRLFLFVMIGWPLTDLGDFIMDLYVNLKSP